MGTPQKKAAQDTNSLYRMNLAWGKEVWKQHSQKKDGMGGGENASCKGISTFSRCTKVH